MNRPLYIAFICAALFALVHRPASAMVEYCPASLSYEAVGKDGPATLFGVELNALGPRLISSALLAFDTSGGWYAAAMPTVEIAKKERHYSSVSATFARRDWVTPVMYVRFPSAVTISHAWVYDIRVTSDGDFKWQERGHVQCDPRPSEAPNQSLSRGNDDIKLDPKDADRLSAPPGDRAVLITAQSTQPLGTTTCSEPFREATVLQEVEPPYPEEMKALRVIGVAAVEVGVNPDGSLADAWVWAPSGYQAFDNEALNAARQSKYKNGRAYCRDVPGRYLFRVTFVP